MRLYLDTADTDAWKALMPTGIFHGITTNPLLIERAGRSGTPDDIHDLMAKAKELGAHQFHAQVSGDPNGYVEWAGRLFEMGHEHGIDAVAKVPLVPGSIDQVPAIKSLDGKVLVTACYHANQGAIAAAVKADFIAPYIGRMAQAGLDTDEQMQQLVGLRDHADHRFKILCGSIKTAEEIAELGAIGIDAVTLSPQVAQDLISNQLSLTAHADFERAAAATAAARTTATATVANNPSDG